MQPLQGYVVPLSVPDLVTMLRRRTDELGDTRVFRYLTTGDVEQGGPEWSYTELDRRARRVAAALAEQITPGDRVILLFPPGLDFIAAFFGCLYAGAIAVPVYPPDPTRLPQTLPRLQAITADAGAGVLLTVAEILAFSEPFREMVPEIGAYHWIAVDDLPAGGEADVRIHTPSPHSPAFLQYTSGSTGLPKGVIVTHSSALANQAMIGSIITAGRGDQHLCWVPLFHDMGLIGSVFHTIYCAGETTFMSPIAFLKDPMRWLRAISHWHMTISAGPDFAFDLAARKATPRDIETLDLSSWRLALNGAEPVRAATLERFARTFAPCGFSRQALCPSLGMAEATLIVTGKRPATDPVIRAVDPDALTKGSAQLTDKPHGRPLVSSGPPVEGTELIIVDPERRTILPDRSVGEIWVRGPHVASGYWNQPEATEATFRAQLADGGPHYLRTGDLGFLMEGELFVTGRRKDLIIVRGRNHYPQDIERTAEGASPLIRSGCSAAFSIDREGGEQVILLAEATGTSEALESAAVEVRTAIAQAHQIQLDEILFIPPRTIFKTSSGKIQRQACRTAWLEGSLEVSARVAVPAPTPPPQETSVPEAGSILDWMVKQLRALTGDPTLRGDRSVAALGIDSLKVVQLTGDLERFVGFQIPVEIFFGHTLEEVATLLAQGVDRLDTRVTIDFAAEAALPMSIRPAGPWREKTGPVLLTGATGFLGSYLLSELLARTTGEILCLVRARDEATAHARLRESLRRYSLLREDQFARVKALPGDLGQERFGLDGASFAQLGATVSSILHCGATVHWASAFGDLRDVNVGGTRTVLALAAPRNVPIHYVSSLGVYPIGATEQSWFAEEGELLDPQHLGLGYFQTKWVAEQLLTQARRRGFSVTIYRPGFISGDSRTGADAGTDGQLIQAFLRGCIEMGSVPRVQKVLDVVPVDFVGAAIVALSLRPEAQGRSFNLVNPHPLPQLTCYAALREMGYSLREVPYPLWRNEVLALPQQQPANPLARFSAWYKVMTERRMARLEQQTAEQLPVEDRNTRALLPPEIACPPFDAALLRRYVDDYLRRDLLPAPRRIEVTTPRAEAGPIAFIDDYAPVDARLIKLYERSKEKQWNASRRIDWTMDLDPENPQELPDSSLPIYGAQPYARMDRKERANLRRHFQAWQLAQFMHGEQGALLCASKIVQQAPDYDSKLYAATQVVDEARHLEVFSRLLREKFELSYPVCGPLKKLLDDVVGDQRWDMTFLGMQVLVEGLALAAFSLTREQSKNPLTAAVNAYVMEDEARHVAFGAMALSRYYPKLSERERDEREQFVVEACYLLRDRFQGDDVWERLGLPLAECQAHIQSSGFLRTYRSQLFSRIVPVIRNIGLWGERVRRAFAQMGVIGFAQVDLAALQAEDERRAEEFDTALQKLRDQREVAS